MARFHPIDSYPDEWLVGSTEQIDGVYRIVRINKGLRYAAGHPEYPTRLAIAVPGSRELPSEDALYTLENEIDAALAPEDGGVKAIVISGIGEKTFREIISYVRADFAADDLRASLTASFPGLAVQMHVENDPDWTFYRSLVDSIH